MRLLSRPNKRAFTSPEWERRAPHTHGEFDPDIEDLFRQTVANYPRPYAKDVFNAEVFRLVRRRDAFPYDPSRGGDPNDLVMVRGLANSIAERWSTRWADYGGLQADAYPPPPVPDPPPPPASDPPGAERLPLTRADATRVPHMEGDFLARLVGYRTREQEGELLADWRFRTDARPDLTLTVTTTTDVYRGGILYALVSAQDLSRDWAVAGALEELDTRYLVGRYYTVSIGWVSDPLTGTPERAAILAVRP